MKNMEACTMREAFWFSDSKCPKSRKIYLIICAILRVWKSVDGGARIFCELWKENRDPMEEPGDVWERE